MVEPTSDVLKAHSLRPLAPQTALLLEDFQNDPVELGRLFGKPPIWVWPGLLRREALRK